MNHSLSPTHAMDHASTDVLRGDLTYFRRHGVLSGPAIGRVIDRGNNQDWRFLRDAVDRDPEVRAAVIRIGAGMKKDDFVGHCFTFWWNYAHHAPALLRRKRKDAAPFVSIGKGLMPASSQPDWEYVVSAAARLQRSLPAAAVVGGTAAALPARHRVSTDADHALPDPVAHFKAILSRLEQEAGWRTHRTVYGKIILGNLDGVDTGIRQLIRTAPLETVPIAIEYLGHTVTVPTYAETLRIKGVFIVKRNATRDFLDFAALAASVTESRLHEAMEPFDRLYPQPNGNSPLHQLILQLGDPSPYDLSVTDWRAFDVQDVRWSSWPAVKERCLELAVALWHGLYPETENGQAG